MEAREKKIHNEEIRVREKIYKEKGSEGTTSPALKRKESYLYCILRERKVTGESNGIFAKRKMVRLPKRKWFAHLNRQKKKKNK